MVLAVVEVAGEIGGGSWLRASVMEAQLVRESDHVLISGIRENEERMDCLGNYAQAAVKRLLGEEKVIGIVGLGTGLEGMHRRDEGEMAGGTEFAISVEVEGGFSYKCLGPGRTEGRGKAGRRLMVMQRPLTRVMEVGVTRQRNVLLVQAMEMKEELYELSEAVMYVGGLPYSEEALEFFLAALTALSEERLSAAGYKAQWVATNVTVGNFSPFVEETGAVLKVYKEDLGAGDARRVRLLMGVKDDGRGGKYLKMEGLHKMAVYGSRMERTDPAAMPLPHEYMRPYQDLCVRFEVPPGEGDRDFLTRVVMAAERGKLGDWVGYVVAVHEKRDSFLRIGFCGPAKTAILQSTYLGGVIGKMITITEHNMLDRAMDWRVHKMGWEKRGRRTAGAYPKTMLEGLTVERQEGDRRTTGADPEGFVRVLGGGSRGVEVSGAQQQGAGVRTPQRPRAGLMEEPQALAGAEGSGMEQMIMKAVQKELATLGVGAGGALVTREEFSLGLDRNIRDLRQFMNQKYHEGVETVRTQGRQIERLQGELEEVKTQSRQVERLEGELGEVKAQTKQIERLQEELEGVKKIVTDRGEMVTAAQLQESIMSLSDLIISCTGGRKGGGGGKGEAGKEGGGEEGGGVRGDGDGEGGVGMEVVYAVKIGRAHV